MLNQLQSRCSISKSVLPSRVYVITDFHRLHFCRCYCVHVSFINSYSLVVLSCRCRTERNAKPNNVTQRERIGRAIVLGAARPVLWLGYSKSGSYHWLFNGTRCISNTHWRTRKSSIDILRLRRRTYIGLKSATSIGNLLEITRPANIFFFLSVFFEMLSDDRLWKIFEYCRHTCETEWAVRMAGWSVHII